MQAYSKLLEEMVSDLQQQHAKCAGNLKRQAANSEPYVQVSLIAAAPFQHHMQTFDTAGKFEAYASELLCQSQ